MNSESEQKAASVVEDRAKALFNDSVERLDARARSRLRQARHAALDELSRSRSRTRWLWAPAGGLMAAAALAALIGSWPGVEPVAPGALPLEDFDIVADAENLELLQDVEFYAWLAQQAPPTTEPVSG